jgi:hypothetical protein
VTSVRPLLPPVRETLDVLEVQPRRPPPPQPANVDEDWRRAPAIHGVSVPELQREGIALLVGQSVLEGAVEANPERSPDGVRPCEYALPPRVASRASGSVGLVLDLSSSLGVEVASVQRGP